MIEVGSRKMVSIVAITSWEEVLTRRELEKGLHWVCPPLPTKKNMAVEPDFLLLKHGCWARLFTRPKKDVAVEPDIFVLFILQTWLLGQALHKTQTTFGC